MSSQRSERAWIPAAVASVGMVFVLLVAWALNKTAGGNRAAPADVDASVWKWLVATNNQFFGAEPFSGGGKVALGTLVAVVALVVIGYAGTWWALRGLRPGSALVPAFLATWAVLVVAAVVASAIRWAIVSSDLPSAGQAQYASLTSGAVSGVRLGWLAALLATVAWLVVRPDTDSADGSWDDYDLDAQDEPEPDREFVMKRRADFNLEDRETARRNAETYGRRETDRPAGSALDRRAPAGTDAPGEAQDQAQPGPTYVGRRSSGHYAEDDAEVPPDLETPPRGSHRG
ncbi:MAG: hypothetical protein JWO46_1701 [Nocardioidaceae bacterium]|nr:hypothetical protein [Nocardioidaceae bacterium]